MEQHFKKYNSHAYCKQINYFYMQIQVKHHRRRVQSITYLLYHLTRQSKTHDKLK